MNNPPRGKDVVCPECNEVAIALVPQGSKIVEPEEDADGKVWVNCPNCGHRFTAHYRTE